MNNKTKDLFLNKKFLFFFGLLLSFAVTLIEVLRGTHYNFMVFANGSRDFWNGIVPYTEEFCVRNLREFLYTPVFSVLFAPFAMFDDNIGAFLWNIFNYVMFYFSVMTLPDHIFSYKKRCYIFWFTLPILAQSLFSFQYNVTIAYIFLFAWSLLEKNHSFWAIVLIMISGLTKIYGIFEISLICCYPKFWKNLGYTVLIAIGLLALPLVNLSIDATITFYSEWFNTLMIHQSSRVFDSLFFAEPLAKYMLPNFRIIQFSTLALIVILFFASHKKWGSPLYRAQCVGILTGWVILMSDSSEVHTYLIALSGYLLWYWSRINRTRLDRILFWALFFLFCIVPVDILCPVPVMLFLTKTLWLHIWVMLFTWFRMVYLTLCCKLEHAPETKLNIPASDNDPIDIVFPSYNPHDNFIDTLKEKIDVIRAHYPSRNIHVIISDDGSTKGFETEVQNKLLSTVDDVEIVLNSHKGKGSAVREGIARSKSKYTIYTDVDMPFTTESYFKIIDTLLNGWDVVIGKRDKNYYNKILFFRRILSLGSKLMNIIFLGIKHSDTQGGLKGLSIPAKEQMLNTRINEFLFDTEFVKLATKNNLSITSVEINLNKDVHMSNMHIKIVLKELHNFIKIIFR